MIKITEEVGISSCCNCCDNRNFESTFDFDLGEITKIYSVSIGQNNMVTTIRLCPEHLNELADMIKKFIANEGV